MGFWNDLFGGNLGDRLSIGIADAKASVHEADFRLTTAKIYENGCMGYAAECARKSALKTLEIAIDSAERLRKESMLRPLVPTRDTFYAALNEYSKACEAEAHRKLIGASDDSELACSARMRFFRAREALMALVFERDISTEELERRIAELMGEPAAEDGHDH